MNTVTVRDLPRTACVMAMTYLYLGELEENGLMEGGCFELSDEGRKVCSELQEAGFEFNDGELEGAVRALMLGAEQRAMEEKPKCA
jgi:hypothetical protein